MDNLIEQLGFNICSEINGDAETCNLDWCNESCSFRLPRLNQALSKVLKDERVEIKCGECDGRKFTTKSGNTEAGRFIKQIPCPTCQGTGSTKEALIKELGEV